jgi:hypothetical protein
VDLVLWSYKKLKITDYINDLSKNDFGGTFLQIADADFMWELLDG